MSDGLCCHAWIVACYEKHEPEARSHRFISACTFWSGTLPDIWNTTKAMSATRSRINLSDEPHPLSRCLTCLAFRCLARRWGELSCPASMMGSNACPRILIGGLAGRCQRHRLSQGAQNNIPNEQYTERGLRSHCSGSLASIVNRSTPRSCVFVH